MRDTPPVGPGLAGLGGHNGIGIDGKGGGMAKWLKRIGWMAVGAVLFFVLTLPAGPSQAVDQLGEWIRSGLRSALQALTGAVG